VNLAGRGAVSGWLRGHARQALWTLLGVGIALRLLLVVFAPHTYGYIYDFYHSAIEILYWNRRLPLAPECGECYQPPLFYLLSAPLFGIGRILQRLVGPVPDLELRMVALLPVICGSACVWLSYRILKWLRLEPEFLVLGTGLVMFLPVLFFSTHGIEADILLALLMMALMERGLVYEAEPSNQTPRAAIGLGALAGLAAATKYSGLVGVAYVVVAHVRMAWTQHFTRPARNLALALTVCAVVGSFKYIDNTIRYGNPLFANGTALQGFDLGAPTKSGLYEFSTFRFSQLLEMTGPSAPAGMLTSLPVYRSFWTVMYGLTWNDLGMFSNPTRHGDPTKPYPWRHVPMPVAALVLVLALVPTGLAPLGLYVAASQRVVRPLLVMTVLAGGAYISWVIKQDSWAIKPKYVLFLAPAYCAYATMGLRWVRERTPSPIGETLTVAWLVLLAVSALYLGLFAIG